MLTRLHVLIIILLVHTLVFNTESIYAQTAIATPAGTNIVATSADTREIGFVNGNTYTISNTNWPTCVAYGLPTSVGIPTVNGYATSITPCTYSNVTYSATSPTDLANGVACFTGTTTYRATNGSAYSNYTVNTRLIITITDNSGGATIPFKQVGNFIVAAPPILPGNTNATFKVKVQIQAYGPSGPVYYTSGTGTTSTSSYTCVSYVNTWTGAIQLYNCMATDNASYICTQYPGTTNNYVFYNGFSSSTTAPNITGAIANGGATNNPTTTFSWSGSMGNHPGSRYEYSYNGGAWTKSSSLGTGTSQAVTLNLGANTFCVRYYDGCNNSYYPSSSGNCVTVYYAPDNSCGSTINHNGNNWTISANTTVSGIHTNVGDLIINSGITATVATGCVFEVNANNITINGAINADYKGNNGGSGGSYGGLWASDGSTDGRGITYCWDKDNCRELRMYGGYAGTNGSGTGAGNAGTAAGYVVGKKQQCNTWDDEGGRVAGSGGGGGGKGGGHAGAGGNGGAGGRGGDETACRLAGCTGGTDYGGSGGAGASIGGGTYDNGANYSVFIGSGGGGAAGGGRGAAGSPTYGGNGGYGGGAIALKSCNSFTIASTGTITANGENGKSGGNGGNSTYTGECCNDLSGGCDERTYSGSGGGGGGGGGGSGGSILISAFGNISIANGASISAKGGDGGSGGTKGTGQYFDNATNGASGGGGGGGYIKIFSNPCASVTNNATTNVSGGSGASGGSAGVYSTNNHPNFSALTAGSITSSSYSICYNTNPTTGFNAGVSTGGANNAALPCTASLPAYQYQWYVTKTACATPTTGTGSSANTGWAAVSGATSQNLSASDVLVGINSVGSITSPNTYCFQRRTQSNNCYVWTGTVSVTILDQLNYGTITSGNQTICYNDDPSNINLSTSASGGAGTYAYQWYYKDGNVTCPSGTSTTGWTSISGATSSSYDPPSGLTVTRTYALMVDPTGTPDCGGFTWSNSCRVVTVYATVNYGTITSGNQTICYNGDPSNITLSASASGGAGTFAYQWYYQDGNVACPSGTSTVGWTSIAGATSSSYDPPSGLTTTRTYALMVDPTGTPDCGGFTWSNSCRVVTVYPILNYGTITSGNQTICYNGDPSNITLSASASGGAGTFAYQWYYQDGNVACPSGTSTVGWTSIAGATSSSYDPPSGLTTTRTYALMVDPTGTPDCGGFTWSNSCRVVTVYPILNYGTITSGNESLCNGGDPSNITLSASASGGAGTFAYQWYYQDGNVACPSGTSTVGWTSIAGATSSSYDPPSGLTTTRTYALMVDPTGTPDCGGFTWSNSCRVVTVYATVNYGTITSGNQTICYNGDPSNITLSASASGGAGTFAYQWYYQDGNVACPSGTSTVGWTSIAGATSSSYDPPSGLTTTRTYALMVDPTGTPDCGGYTWSNSCRVVYISGEIAPIAGDIIATATSSQTCVVNDALWHYFRNSTGQIIAAINSNGQDLGNVTMTVTIETVPHDGTYLSPKHGNGGLGHGMDCFGQPELSMRRWYTITPTNQPGVGSPSTIRLFFTPADYTNYSTEIGTWTTNFANNYVFCYGQTLFNTDLAVSKNELEDIPVASTSGSGGPNSTTQYQLSIPSFSTFRFHTYDGIGQPLPVELTSFTGTNEGNKNRLDWVTASETNTSKFVVEKSLDANNWNYLGETQAAGNSTTTHNYQLYDNAPIFGNNYYRLKIVDIDGSISYSRVINVSVNSVLANSIVNIYPNPTNHLLNVDVQSVESANTEFKVYDVIGQSVLNKNVNLNKGITQTTLDCSNLAKGTYILMYKDASGKMQQAKFVKD